MFSLEGLVSEVSMEAFTLLRFDNSVVFEDDEISVRGYSGGLVGAHSNGTIFFFVVAGYMAVNSYHVSAGMYGMADARDFRCYARYGCNAMLVAAKHYRGVFTIGGPIERRGRLQYIDGCTDSGLIAPMVKGDPCLNYLHFPRWIKQTPHVHPSHRVGAVFDGRGICHTENAPVPLQAGSMFMIPAYTLHHFENENDEMRIVAFHPSSTFGPTDESHQMYDETIFP